MHISWCTFTTRTMGFFQLPKRSLVKFPNLYGLCGVILVLTQVNSSIDTIQNGDTLTTRKYLSQPMARYTRQNTPNNETCQIPSHIRNTKFTIPGKSNVTCNPGDYVQLYTTLEISCNPGYKLRPDAANRFFCITGEWIPLLTSNCLRTCPSLTTTTSTNVKCTYNNVTLRNCLTPIEGTTVFLTCNPLYQEGSLQRNPVRLCRAGRWTSGVSECYPICGMKTPNTISNIANSKNATVGDYYPWHIGIYNNQKELQCGGSIIDMRIILTAAHCVTDQEGNVLPTENYLVAGGKYYRNYDDERDTFAQYSNVLQIYVPERFKAQVIMNAFDIAVIILTRPFTVSLAVQPICIEMNEEHEYLHLALNDTGIVMGWGNTAEGNKLSEVLKAVEVQYIPHGKCFQDVTNNNYRRYITYDKICGDYLRNNGTALCGEDSGGGLYFIDNVVSKQYYIKGIVNLPQTTEEFACDSNQYSMYTSVRKHMDFVRDILIDNQIIQESVECTTNDCTKEEIPEIEQDIENRISNHSYDNTLHVCPSLYSSTSTVVKCKYNGQTLPNCENATNGTMAFFSCNPFFEETSLQQNPIRLCRDGKWNQPIPECYPICGLKQSNGNSSEIDGQENRRSDYPWHVGIYSNTKELVCGGSIITPQIILSAAHCFTDLEGNVSPVVNYLVGAGKYYRVCDDKRDEHPQYSQIREIHIPQLYEGVLTSTEYNIAALVLSIPFSLSITVQPICLEWFLESTSLKVLLNNNSVGIVPGWGYVQTGRPLSDVLKELTLPYIPHDKCLQEVPKKFVGFVTQDKICGGYLNNGTSICRGESGGGFIFKDIANDRYYIKGIASSAPVTEDGRCDRNQYATYTLVTSHIEFIKDVIIQTFI